MTEHPLVCDHPSLVSEACVSDEVDKGGSNSIWEALGGVSTVLSELRLDETRCSLCQYVFHSVM